MGTLIFGTTYIDNADRLKLTDYWLLLAKRLNPKCDILLVDSYSPMMIINTDDFRIHEPGIRSRLMLHTFPDNIGHLSRRGRDGWGRAFCYGLQAAIDGGYDHVVHIEGDSLFRLPVSRIIDSHDFKVASIPVKGMLHDEDGWVETGLMFFDVEYLNESNFIYRYDWENRKVHPTPEAVIFRMLGDDLTMLPLKGLRADKNQITHQNIVSLDLDWVTHCHNDFWVYDRFVSHEIEKIKNMEHA